MIQEPKEEMLYNDRKLSTKAGREAMTGVIYDIHGRPHTADSPLVYRHEGQQRADGPVLAAHHGPHVYDEERETPRGAPRGPDRGTWHKAKISIAAKTNKAAEWRREVN